MQIRGPDYNGSEYQRGEQEGQAGGQALENAPGPLGPAISAIRGAGDVMDGIEQGNAGKVFDGGLKIVGSLSSAGKRSKSDGTLGAKEGKGSKSPPNPGGKLGKPPHRAKVADRAGELEREGHTITGGGGRKLPEERIPTPNGDKSYRSPDITSVGPDGKIHRENIGRETQGGQPISREQRALDDIEGATGQRPKFTPYDW
jgi:hypothetical protein